MFQIANYTALVGWLVLLASPFIQRLADLISSIVIPGLLAIAYAGLIFASWSSSQGGFDSLENVALLFQTREMLLAGWIHYLAFDLFVGAWIVRAGRRSAMPFWVLVPCLALTFLFGPIGFFVFLALRLVYAPRDATATATA
jgi:hypothetical protein